MLIPIENLQPNTRFRLGCDPGITGTLLSATPCCATVKIDGGVRDVSIEEADSEVRTIRAQRGKQTTWSLATLVEPIFSPEPATAGSNNEESEMATKTTTKKTGTKKATKKAAPKKESKAKSDGKLSALDAAAKVLSETKEPMNTKAMVEAMAQKGYWKSPGGKTPHATLYSAILREIDTKGGEARFKKTDRGTFALKA